MKTRYLRYTMYSIVFGLLIYLALGFGKRSFEAYCPFGGMESLWGLFKQGQFSCTLGPLNLTMMIGVLALAIVAKKAFCGWVCPIGFMGELLNRLGMKIFPRRFTVSGKLDGKLKLLRYIVLVIALYLTYKTGELVLRGYDPFYPLFSGFGHGTMGWITYAVMAVLLTGSLLIPMFFCRYLCPMGATFDPFSKLGIIRPVRNPETCTDCHHCEAACPQGLAPHRMIKVSHRDCTNCLECVDACEETDTLELKLTL